MIFVEKDGVTMGARDDAQLDAFLGSGWKIKAKPEKAEQKPIEKEVKTPGTRSAVKKSPGKPKKEQ